MTEPQMVDEAAFEPFIETPPAEPAFVCGVCGKNRATHILTALDDPDADLFCSPCLIITFVGLANEMGQDGS